ncbi:hypothetical protein Y032_0070g407 [Ancylostoma ceylanicum]|nr:hypothetical protein Y032_0070g407 [Ancylostoma ceylanicum]
MSSSTGSTARKSTRRTSGRSKAGAESPVEAPAAPNIITAGESALTKVLMIPSKSVTFYPNEKRQQTYLIISNNSDRRVMFKMKSTRPGVYKMKPVHGVINPTEKYSIRIAYMGIKVGHRIPVNDRITVVLASVSNKGEGDKKDVVEGEMRKRKLNILFKGVNDQEAEQEGEGDGQKKLSAEKPVDRKTYMNGYDEGYKAALIESTEGKGSAGPAKALERLQKTKGIGKEPAFQEGFTEGYKKATAMLKTTGSKEANQPSKELAKAPSKEPAKAPSKEIVKAPSKEIAVLSKERLKGGPRTKSKEKVKPSKERVKALSKEKAVPLKKVAKPPSKEPVKTASKEVVKAPSKETAKPLPVEQVKAVKKVKAPSKEAAEEPSKEIVKQPSKEPAKPPPKEPVKEQEKVKVEVKKEEAKKEEVKEVKKEGKVEKEAKPTDGRNVTAVTPGGTDPSLGDPLKRQDIAHLAPTGKKQVVIVMYRDPQAAENLLSRSGDEDDDDDNMPSEPSQPPIPPQEPQ